MKTFESSLLELVRVLLLTSDTKISIDYFRSNSIAVCPPPFRVIKAEEHISNIHSTTPILPSALA